MKFGYIIIIVLLFLILLFFSNFWFLRNSYRPYYSNSIFRKEYPYEPFSSVPSVSSSPPNVKPNPDNSLFQGTDFNTPEKPLDLFSQLKSSPECVGSSAGLYNSTGGLCLSSDAMNALKTRGGNQSITM